MTLNLIKNIPVRLIEINENIRQVGIQLDSDGELNAREDIKISILLTDKIRCVLSEQHIVSHDVDNQSSLCGSVVFDSQNKLKVDLFNFPLDIERVVFVISHSLSKEKQLLIRGLNGVFLVFSEIGSGIEFARVELDEQIFDEPAAILGEFYRVLNGWAVNIQSQGFADGRSGIVSALSRNTDCTHL